MYPLILILTMVYSFSLKAQNNQNISANLDALFQYCSNNKLFNGSVFIFKKDQILFKKSYGNLSHESSESISSDTPFLLASISKQFTAFAIVQLHSKGLLNYDDYAKKYLPDFPYPQITIRHLLNHTSGIPEYTKLINSQAPILNKKYEESGAIITNQIIASIIANRQIPLRFQPGSNFHYTNTGYLYLAMLIETLSGKSYSQYLDEFIFKPLKMENSWVVDSRTSLRKERAIAYKVNYIKNTSSENEVPAFFKVYGDGGIYSSTNDLYKWYIALNKGTLLDTQELNEVYTPPIINAKKAPYGFGWFIRTLSFNNHIALTHSGQFVGFTNSIFRDLESQTTSIVLSNNSHKINSEINRAIVKILYKMPYKNPKLSAKIVLSKKIVLENIQQAKKLYELYKENEDYDFSEKAINSLGYDFLKANLLNKAIDIFKWNVERHPTSTNVYDSLGEAYFIIGNKKEALKNYQKAIRIDSTNSNANKMIKK